MLSSDVKRKREENGGAMDIYLEISVSIPPKTVPNAPPIGAPAAKVANAVERAREGGNARARIPSWKKNVVA
jgi:hypothetical protein